MQKSRLIFTKRTHSSRSRVFSTLKRENSFSLLEKEMVGDFFFFFEIGEGDDDPSRKTGLRYWAGVLILVGSELSHTQALKVQDAWVVSFLDPSSKSGCFSKFMEAGGGVRSGKGERKMGKRQARASDPPKELKWCSLDFIQSKNYPDVVFSKKKKWKWPIVLLSEFHIYSCFVQ